MWKQILQYCLDCGYPKVVHLAVLHLALQEQHRLQPMAGRHT